MRLIVAVVAVLGCGRETPGVGKVGVAPVRTSDAYVNHASCPAELAAAAKQSCTLGASRCVYAEGWCDCQRPYVCQGAVSFEPPPEGPPIWHCTQPRTDGCPDELPEGACGVEGKRCDYFIGCCQEHVTCKDKRWERGQGGCVG